MRKFLTIAAMAICTAAIAPAVSSAGTVGQYFAPTDNNSCNGGPETDLVQTGRESGPSYVVPFAGVLTSWSFEAPSSLLSTTMMNMRVFRPTGSAHQYTVVTDGSDLQAIAAGSGVHTFLTRVAVQAGDFVGIRATVGTCGVFTNNAADTFDWYYGASLAAGDQFADPYAHSGEILDIAADLEADADHDGFGDESQDQCPFNPSAKAAPCPITPASSATGARAAALKDCKKRAQKKHWSHKRLAKCRKKTKLLPV
jgi:hypothetical protein